jgi:phage tail-like protein
MATGTRIDPFRGYNFYVLAQAKGFTVEMGFKKVSGLDVEVEVTEYREGTDVATVRKLPGLAKYSNIVLERGITDNGAAVEWMQEIVKLTEESGLAADADFRSEVTIQLLNRNQEVVREWQATAAWPAKLTVGDFDATSSDVAIETLELVHEGLTCTQFGG